MNAGINVEPIGNRDAVLSIPARATHTRRLAHRFGQGLAMLALALASYFLVSRFVVESVTVVGLSMRPTLGNGDHYLLNRWVFHVRSPQRSEIVVIRDPSDNGFAVKRIVGLAGDSICLRHGRVYLNGRPLAEPYLAPGTPTYASPFAEDQSFTCGKDQYFLLGDNRNNSIDSRTYGPVPRGNILGLVVR